VGEDRTGATSADRRRLTVPQAAEALGVTVDAVRGRIRRGKLKSEQHAGTVYVWLDALEDDDSRGPSATSHRPSDDQSERIEDFREQVAYLREQLQAERQAHAEARRLLMAALERIPPQLEAPSEEPSEAPETVEGEPERAAEHQPATGGAQEATQRPWWRRVFGG
jgi:transposase-like protein